MESPRSNTIRTAVDPSTGKTTLALLGASNVWLALPEIVEHLTGRFHSSPADVHVAHGPGRSYGSVAGVLGWKYPSLRDCGIFAALPPEAPSSTSTRRRALLTDVGNDIGYGASVDQIAGWVRDCIESLQARDVEVSLTAVPAESVTALSPLKFGILRRLLFPTHRLTHRDCRERILAVSHALEELSNSLGVLLLPTSPDLYSFDAIHVRRSCRRRIFGYWIDRALGWTPENLDDRSETDEADDERPADRSRPRTSALALWRRLPTRAALKRAGNRGSLPPICVSPNVKLHVY